MFTPIENAEPRRGAEIMLEVLQSEGCEYIFGNPGTTELPLMDALVGAPSIQYIWGLQEASVVAMADGYAQASGKPGFVNLHTAGGLGHAMGNLLNAAASYTPLVVTAGQQDSRHTLSDPLLFGNLVELAKPAVKWAQEATSADHLPVLVRRAFHDCTAAPAGPCFLSLPMDVMEEMSTASILRPSTIDRLPVGGSLDLLADYLAETPLGKVAIIAGDEITQSKASLETVELAETLGAPVYGSSWPARIPYPTSHPQWRGNLPPKASEIAQILQNYDCIFALGGKSLITILYTEESAVPRGCEVYQLSSDVRDLGRTYPSKLSVVGDIKHSLLALIPLLKQRLEPHKDAILTLRKKEAERDKARRLDLNARAERDLAAPVISPLLAARELAKGIGPRVPIIDEAIATANHLRGFLNSTTCPQYSFLRGGALGWGMPAAVGFSLGFGRVPVVSLVGDGAALYSPQAIWTAAHENLPVTFIVINNREYNVLKNFMRGQESYLSNRQNQFIAMDITDPPIDYLAMAQSYGVKAQSIQKAGDIAPAVEEAIFSGATNLIEIIVSA